MCTLRAHMTLKKEYWSICYKTLREFTVKKTNTLNTQSYTMDVRRVLKKRGLSDLDISVVQRYIDFRFSVAGPADSTVSKDLNYLAMFRRKLRCESIESMNTDDVLAAISVMRSDYAENTFNSVWKTVKPFLKWYVGNYPGININLDTITAVRLTKPGPVITSADILTPEQISILRDHCCTNSRDRAALMLLYDSGGRATETLCNTRWGDFVFDSRGVKFNLAGKTKKQRHVRLLLCQQYLAAWRSDYPGDARGDNPVFVRRGYRGGGSEPYQYSTVQMWIRRMEAKYEEYTGNKIHLHAHIFRHSRITHMIREGYPLAYVSMQMWGVPSSPQILYYVHLCGDDMDKMLFKHLGMDDPGDTMEKPLTPSQCPHCRTVISPGYTYCPECGRLLATADPQCDDTPTIEQMAADPELMARFLLQLARRG